MPIIHYYHLTCYVETTMAEMPEFPRSQPSPAYKRIKGGRLDFWNDPSVANPKNTLQMGVKEKSFPGEAKNNWKDKMVR
jgi:hypothetical protein